MRAFTLVFAIAALSACVPDAAPVPSGPTLPDTCGASGLAHLVGQPRAAVAAGPLPSSHRILEPGAIVTQDYAPARLNIHLDEAGRVARLACG